MGGEVWSAGVTCDKKYQTFKKYQTYKKTMLQQICVVTFKKRYV